MNWSVLTTLALCILVLAGMNRVNVNKLVKNLYICYVPTGEKKTLAVRELQISPNDKGDVKDILEMFEKGESGEVREIEADAAYDIYLLNLSRYDIDEVKPSLLNVTWDEDCKNSDIRWLDGELTDLPATGAQYVDTKLEEEFGSTDTYSWTLSVKGVGAPVYVEFEDNKGYCGSSGSRIWDEENLKDLPIFGRKGYMIQVKQVEKPIKERFLK